jgi:hypothetical protein
MTSAHAANQGEATMHRSATHQDQPAAGARRRAALRSLVPLAGAAGLMLGVSACSLGAAHHAAASGTRPHHATAAAKPAAPAHSAPAAPAPPAPATPAPSTSTVPATTAGYTGPHFPTPQAAMTYLAAAYNSDDTAALHAVTNAQSFASLQSMRSTDVGLRLTSCRATGHGDDECTFRYTYVGEGQHAARNAMVTAAPALNPGWYMYRFIEGCD